MSAQSKHITIGVRVGGDEISHGEHPTQLCIGWLGLIVRLDELLGTPSSTAAQRISGYLPPRLAC